MRQQLPWVIAAVAGASLLLVVGTTRRGHAVVHPDARPGVSAERVLSPSLVLDTPGALEAYAAARSAPQLLDALYCHCQCARNFGHRSLLTCFESDHGSQCDVCMGEAMLATQLAGQGNSLVQIRHAIDERFGS